MTFNDGIVGVYELTEIIVAGEMPTEGLSEIDRFYFGYDNLGISRYYTALQAKQEIESVINVPGWNTIKANTHIAVIAKNNGEIDSTCDQFRIVMVQPTTDEDGLRITKLSLERIGENYAVFS